MPPLRVQCKSTDCCPECGAEDSLVAAGPGVERIEEEVSQLFPDARTGIASVIPFLMGQH